MSPEAFCLAYFLLLLVFIEFMRIYRNDKDSFRLFFHIILSFAFIVLLILIKLVGEHL